MRKQPEPEPFPQQNIELHAQAIPDRAPDAYSPLLSEIGEDEAHDLEQVWQRLQTHLYKEPSAHAERMPEVVSPQSQAGVLLPISVPIQSKQQRSGTEPRLALTTLVALLLITLLSGSVFFFVQAQRPFFLSTPACHPASPFFQEEASVIVTLSQQPNGLITIEPAEAQINCGYQQVVIWNKTDRDQTLVSIDTQCSSTSIKKNTSAHLQPSQKGRCRFHLYSRSTLTFILWVDV